MPFSCVMIVYDDLTSHVTSKVSAGIVPLLLISDPVCEARVCFAVMDH